MAYKMNIDDPRLESSKGVLKILSRWINKIEKTQVNGKEIAEYARQHCERFTFTVKLVKKGEKVLEIGADPFFITYLLFLKGVDVIGISGPQTIWPAETTPKLRYKNTSIGPDNEFSLTHYFLNVEREPLPFADESFDVVLFTEVLEHLLHDPSFALKEINRVLKYGGRVVVSTPNLLWWGCIFSLLSPKKGYYPVADQYSGYGPYGRHNRLYAQWEVEELLKLHGFYISLSMIADFSGNRISRILYNLTSSVPIRYLRTRAGNTIFVVGTKVRKSQKPLYPEWLYRARYDAFLSRGYVMDMTESSS
jgi:SAM-dependent methyltransferase